MEWHRGPLLAGALTVALAGAVASAGVAGQPSRHAPPAAPASAGPAGSCENLRSLSLPNTTIDRATAHPSDATTPASCRVQLSVTHPPAGDDVKVWIYLPAQGWNGRFQGVGGGGFTAGTEASLLGPLRQGYAAGATDGGNPQGTAASLALKADGTLNWQGQQNFGYLAIHDMTVAGKALVKAYYGRSQHHAYFNGCSTGGRQGMMEAQRYPDDYDGIAAGAPVFNYPELAISQIWGQTVMHVKENPVAACKFEAALAAAIKACDTIGDGVRDGVIGDPLACRFDPATLIGTKTPCGEITATDVDVLRQIRQGPRRTSGEFLWYGLLPGAPFAGLHDTEVADGELVGRPFPFVIAVIANWLEQDPSWDWRTITLEGFEQYVDQAVEMYDAVQGASDPDLSRYERAGGKILMWHGLADFGVFAEGTMDYYERVGDELGSRRVDRFLRLFLAPGVDHCGGGVGPQPTGQLDALVEWVEQGRAPSTIAAIKRDPAGAIVQTRPICRYPYVARFKGHGDPADGSRYRCERAARLSRPEED